MFNNTSEKYQFAIAGGGSDWNSTTFRKYTVNTYGMLYASRNEILRLQVRDVRAARVLISPYYLAKFLVANESSPELVDRLYSFDVGEYTFTIVPWLSCDLVVLPELSADCKELTRKNRVLEEKLARIREVAQ